MFSLSDSAQVHRWAKQLHRLQRNPWIVYGAALSAILIATSIRWAMGGLVHDRIPFTTYYPAIVVATLLGGFWLGILASVLSAIIAIAMVSQRAISGDYLPPGMTCLVISHIIAAVKARLIRMGTQMNHCAPWYSPEIVL